MALTGFNPEAVNSSVTAVNTAYNELMNTLYTGVQKNFVEAMADKWAAPQAVNAMAEIVNVMNGLCYSGGDSINTIFESVVSSMNSAATAWADQTGAGYNAVAYNEFGQRFDSGSIQEKGPNNVIGIDLEAAQQVAATLPAVADSVVSALNSAKNAVSASGFIGADQQQALDSSLEEIKGNVSTAFNTIAETAKKAIDSTVAEYGNTGGRVAQAFAGNM